ncbi:abortive infection [Chlorella sorokiniana]|uniref:Abortive infection n=1 Tax=Chlorella sorokiniana TaxID=3076 RepID=A0A2P6TFR4_CHLSO|nr:abortive infection [Chlorella sorokiniana]|eukprot:PRW32939.1 abortive infection [Chlorella sorokiniana]
MAVAGVVLGDRAGLDVSGQLLRVLNTLDVPAALAYMLPLLAACYVGVAFADRLEGFSQLRDTFKAALIPQLRILPFWGLGLMALGAGVGEETLFRAFMQEALCGGLADAAPSLPATLTTAAGVAVASVIFGALHALTPTYFLFATGAGALFGVEYLLYGLPTAAVTHWIYDWIALAFILREWGGSSGAEEAG